MPTSTQNKKEVELEKKLSEIQIKRTEEDSIALAKKFNLPFSDLKSAPIDNDALIIIDEDTARSSGLAIIYKSGNKLTVAITDPENSNTQKTIEMLKNKGLVINPVVTSPSTLENILNRYKFAQLQELFEVGAIDIKEEELNKIQDEIKTIGDLKNKFTKISATEMLETLIAGALKIGASDIHFEPEIESIRLRYRFDGVLNDVTFLDKPSYEKVLSRIKVLSKLKLNIHSSPQDGRFTIRQKTVDIEVRVSILPSEFGETIVMRLLDPRTIKTKLEDLGMRDDLLKIVKEQLNRSTGAILTTGPTGSGKTTSLYAFAQHLNSSGTKIITIEDPIEYHVKGISQTQVDTKKGYSFANGLRAIVRQDPDVILVGEIRDEETADIALQAALTGHLVLSTIHTNDSAGTIPRLIDLGIQPQIIAPAINIAMAQRLIRKLCPSCKIKDRIEPKILKKIQQTLSPISSRFKLPKIDSSLEVYFPGKGCKECNELSYKGRVGVYEAFVISKEMERLILKSPAISDVQESAEKQGMVTMLQDAYMKLLNGITSIEEVDRILG
ncbi:MAG TPA: GspE/PulE family protein [Candidatus Paceibacterota bacterium]